MIHRPHFMFTSWSPDEVAECMDGVDGELYAKLWSLVPLLPERGETPDTQFERGLAKFWDHLDDDEKIQLNEIAMRYENKVYGALG
jgi:hypothetical protein